MARTPGDGADSCVPCPTGLAGRPLPVEQSAARPRLARTILTQLAEPFTSIRTESR